MSHIVVPYVILWDETIKAVPDARFVLMQDEEHYWRLLSELWESGETFTIVEHDVAPTRQHLESIDACSEPVCGLTYAFRDTDQVSTGLGCIRFSGGFTRAHPDLMHNVGLAQQDGLGAPHGRHWRYLHQRIFSGLAEHGVEVHSHEETSHNWRMGGLDTWVISRFYSHYVEVGAAYTTYHGAEMQKCPSDLWTYVEIIQEVKPDLIVETGTYLGCSAQFFADQARLVNPRAEVVTVDISPRSDLFPTDRTFESIVTSSTDPSTVAALRERSEGRSVMVVLDSDHSAAHVEDELNALAPLVSVGSYLVVEDTNLNGPLIAHDWGDGPKEALARWLPDHPEFVVDDTREKHGLTMFPGGWLRRVK